MIIKNTQYQKQQTKIVDFGIFAMWGEVAIKRTPLRSTATEAGYVLSLDCAQGKNLDVSDCAILLTPPILTQNIKG